MLEPEVLKARQVRRSLQDDVTAVSAVSAVRSAVGNILLGMETESAVTAVTGLHINLRVINKHLFLLQKIKSSPRLYSGRLLCWFLRKYLNQATG